jgi:hypothetical protein
VNSPQSEDGKNQVPVDGPTEAPGSAAEDKRAAARRRFLKMGAGGSTAMMVTIMHKRAYAATTLKKGAIVSTCVSLQGYPDIKHMDRKKALQLSPGGTPKGVVCMPKPKTNQCVANQASKYYNDQGQKVLVVDGGKLGKGCGNIDDSLFFQRDYRLYELGHCPVKQLPNGDLTYETGLLYFEKDGDCKVGDVDKKTGAVCVGIGTKQDGKPITFWQRTCD